MNIIDAIKSGKPFFHSDMIGAYKAFHGTSLIQRDNILDFADEVFITGLIDHHESHALPWLDVTDLLRDDWAVVTFKDEFLNDPESIDRSEHDCRGLSYGEIDNPWFSTTRTPPASDHFSPAIEPEA